MSTKTCSTLQNPSEVLSGSRKLIAKGKVPQRDLAPRVHQVGRKSYRSLSVKSPNTRKANRPRRLEGTPTPLITNESWLPVVGYEGLYSISSRGRLRSERRIVKVGNHTKIVSERIKKTPPNQDGYPTARLSREGQSRTVYIHDLVTQAFIGDKPDGQQVRHLDDRKLNCRTTNLAFGTRSDNGLDAVRNGRNANANKTHCPAGHAYTPENTYIRPAKGWRVCRTCAQDRQAQKNMEVAA